MPSGPGPALRPACRAQLQPSGKHPCCPPATVQGLLHPQQKRQRRQLEGAAVRWT